MFQPLVGNQKEFLPNCFRMETKTFTSEDSRCSSRVQFVTLFMLLRKVNSKLNLLMSNGDLRPSLMRLTSTHLKSLADRSPSRCKAKARLRTKSESTYSRKGCWLVMRILLHWVHTCTTSTMILLHSRNQFFNLQLNVFQCKGNY